jgi:hypothetical protein
MSTYENFISEKTVDYDINHFIDKINNKKPFSYSRFNDGELLCVIKQLLENEVSSNNNCDGHIYFPKMGEELLVSLNNSDCENYYIQYMSGWLKSEKFFNYTKLLIDNNSLNGIYQYSDFLQITLRENPDLFRKFVNILNNNEIMIVGPEYLKNIKFLKYSSFVEIPSVNCYNKKDEIINEISKKINDRTIVLFSASMATNVIIDSLYKIYGQKNFLIDVGSLWDIFFYKSNSNIKQRSINYNKLDIFNKWYEEYFI